MAGGLRKTPQQWDGIERIHGDRLTVHSERLPDNTEKL